MRVQRFRPADAVFERSPGQDQDIFTADLVGEADGGPVTVGYGRWDPGVVLTETMAVHDTMVVLEGRLWISTDGEDTVEAGPGDIVHMPKGEMVTIRTRAEGARTAYVTWPHWRTGRD